MARGHLDLRDRWLVGQRLGGAGRDEPQRLVQPAGRTVPVGDVEEQPRQLALRRLRSSASGTTLGGRGDGPAVVGVMIGVIHDSPRSPTGNLLGEAGEAVGLVQVVVGEILQRRHEVVEGQPILGQHLVQRSGSALVDDDLVAVVLGQLPQVGADQRAGAYHPGSFPIAPRDVREDILDRPAAGKYRLLEEALWHALEYRIEPRTVDADGGQQLALGHALHA
jgi:hypothetical protein